MSYWPHSAARPENNPMPSLRAQKIILTLIISAVILAPAIALAATAASDILEGINKTADQAQISKGDEKSPTDNLAVMLGRVINYMFGVVGVVFLTVILIGGYKWMAAGGNTEDITKAKTFILNGIFGLIVIFIAYSLVYVVLVSLAGSTGNNGPFP